MIFLTKELLNDWLDTMGLNSQYNVRFTIRHIGNGNLQYGNNEPAAFVGTLMQRNQSAPLDAFGEQFNDKQDWFGIFDQRTIGIPRIGFIGFQITFNTIPQLNTFINNANRFLPATDVITDY